MPRNKKGVWEGLARVVEGKPPQNEELEACFRNREMGNHIKCYWEPDKDEVRKVHRIHDVEFDAGGCDNNISALMETGMKD